MCELDRIPWCCQNTACEAWAENWSPEYSRSPDQEPSRNAVLGRIPEGCDLSPEARMAKDPAHAMLFEWGTGPVKRSEEPAWGPFERRDAFHSPETRS